MISVSADNAGLLVVSAVAQKQMDAEIPSAPQGGNVGTGSGPGKPTDVPGSDGPVAPPGGRGGPQAPALRRFHGTVQLDPARVGRDASRIADEVIAHLAGQLGSDVTVTLEIEAKLPTGASDQTIRAVTENSRTLKFTSHGFERE